MVRFATALAVLICLFATASSQARKQEATLHAEQQEGKWVWSLDANGEIEVNRLLEHYAVVRDVLIIADPKKISGVVGWTGPARELTDPDFDLFVANGLQNYRLVLVDSGRNQRMVVPAAEAMTYAPVIAIADIEKANPASWAITRFVCKNIDPVVVRSGLMNLTNREGGNVSPFREIGVVISDRVDRLQNILKMAIELDEAGARETVQYGLAEGVEADAAVKALRELFPEQFGPTFAVAPNSNAILARETAHKHGEIRQAIDAMK